MSILVFDAFVERRSQTGHRSKPQLVPSDSGSRFACVERRRRSKRDENDNHSHDTPAAASNYTSGRPERLFPGRMASVSCRAPVA